MTLAAIVNIVVYLIVAGIILGLLLYLVNISPVPEPYKGWLRFLIVALTILLIIYLLLGLIGGGTMPRVVRGALPTGVLAWLPPLKMLSI